MTRNRLVASKWSQLVSAMSTGWARSYRKHRVRSRANAGTNRAPFKAVPNRVDIHEHKTGSKRQTDLVLGANTESSGHRRLSRSNHQPHQAHEAYHHAAGNGNPMCAWGLFGRVEPRLRSTSYRLEKHLTRGNTSSASTPCCMKRHAATSSRVGCPNTLTHRQTPTSSD